MKKAILFDLDGTLWDSTLPVSKAWSHITEALPSPFKITQEDFRGVMGLPMDKLCRTLFKGRIPEEEIDRTAKKAEIYENEYLLTHPGTPFDGVPETLLELQKKYALYVVSNCQRGYIEAFFESNGLGKYFKGKLSYGDTLLQKGENILLLLKKEGIKKAFYLGDTEGDEKATRFAKLPFVFASYGFGKALAPDYSIASFKELSDVAAKIFEERE